VLAFEIAVAPRSRRRHEGGAEIARTDHAGEVVTPEDYMGDVIGDLNSRRGQVTAWTVRATPGSSIAMVPLANMSATSTPCVDEPGSRPVHDAFRPLRAGPAGRRDESAPRWA